jgi:dihydroxy-acid dehydratase
MARENLRPSQIMTRAAIENAITVDMAIGGSTNAVIHLLALAGRLGIELNLDDFDRISRRTPVLANIKPSGQFLMEDLFYAGGIPALMTQIEDLRHVDALTVTGKTLGENIASARIVNEDVIRRLDNALSSEGGTATLWGNLAPDGAIIKQSAASPRLLRHRGRAVVFKTIHDMLVRIDAPDLPVDADSLLVLQNAGPKGGPGMPEWGRLPIPRKLLEQGIDDMVRLSDARMSGTAYGTVVLHVAPESAVGGPLALVQDGDEIELDVPNRCLMLHVSEAELAARHARWQPPAPHYARGYGKLFVEHVTQANVGCDFDFFAQGYRAQTQQFYGQPQSRDNVTGSILSSTPIPQVYALPITLKHIPPWRRIPADPSSAVRGRRRMWDSARITLSSAPRSQTRRAAPCRPAMPQSTGPSGTTGHNPGSENDGGALAPSVRNASPRPVSRPA